MHFANPEGFPLSSGRSGSKVKLKSPNALSELHHLTDFRLELMFSVQCTGTAFFIHFCSFKQILLQLFYSVAKLGVSAVSLSSESSYRRTFNACCYSVCVYMFRLGEGQVSPLGSGGSNTE